MPKRYHCEFCNKSFQDTPVARKRHLQGAGHQRNRRLHYDSFASEGVRGQAMNAGRAAILYTGMNGEEILQQWLDSHPEVVERHKEPQRKRGARTEMDRKETGQDDVDRGVREAREPSPQMLQRTLVSSTADTERAPLIGAVNLPHYLQPYRDVLPPSLLPIPSRTAYPHTLIPDDTSGWG